MACSSCHVNLSRQVLSPFITQVQRATPTEKNKQTNTEKRLLIYGIYTMENGFTYVVIMSLDHLIKQQRQIVKLIGTYWRMLLAKMINHGALCTFALKIRFSQLAN